MLFAHQIPKLFANTDERILPHPTNAHLVVRKCQIETRFFGDPHATIRYAQRHLGQLAACGIQIPRTRFYLDPQISHETLTLPAYAVVDRVQGVVLKDSASEDPRIIASLKDYLNEYLSRTERLGQRYKLRDIYRPDQYHIGTLSKQPNQEPRIILHDIEPLFVNAAASQVWEDYLY